jgi:hypothetical protein
MGLVEPDNIEKTDLKFYFTSLILANKNLVLCIANCTSPMVDGGGCVACTERFFEIQTGLKL